MIAYYSILFISTTFLSLVIKWGRRWFYEVAENSVGLLNDLLSKADEDIKVKEVSKGTSGLLRSLGKVILLISIAVIAGLVPVLIHIYIFNADYSDVALTGWLSILVISVAATIIYFVPINPTRSEYSEMSQLLHRMILNNYYLGQRLFKRELRKIKKKGIKTRPDFVVVSGLARAGTTSLMNDLAKNKQLVSLSYASMPFLLSPNLWKRFYNPKKQKLKERSHKDGIMIGLNSNEALEEYFFKVKLDDSFIQEDALVLHDIDEDVYNDYLNYQRVICNDSDKLYLAKNNNFLLRYQSIRNHNSDFKFLLLFRDPLTHAASLLEKHLEYLESQEQDPFILEYMNWLGHHEFGKGHKVFEFNSEFSASDSPDTLDYWLQVWINYYSYALSIEDSNTLFINYDDYCSKPNEVIQEVSDLIATDVDDNERKPYRNNRSVSHSYNAGLLNSATEIFESLKKK